MNMNALAATWLGAMPELENWPLPAVTAGTSELLHQSRQLWWTSRLSRRSLPQTLDQSNRGRERQLQSRGAP